MSNKELKFECKYCIQSDKCCLDLNTRHSDDRYPLRECPSIFDCPAIEDYGFDPICLYCKNYWECSGECDTAHIIYGKK